MLNIKLDYLRILVSEVTIGLGSVHRVLLNRL